MSIFNPHRTVALLATAAALSCNGEAAGPAGASVATISVAPTSSNLAIGASLPLQATVHDADGNPLTGKKIFFTSSDSGIARVSSTGVVTARTLGTAQIAASSEGHSAISVITVVQQPVSTVTVLPNSSQLSVGQTVQLQAATYDASGNQLSGRSVLWSSTNTSVATVDGSGVVTARGPGSATISATSEGKTGNATVQVTLIPIATISLAPPTATLAIGDQAQMTATPRDAGGNVLTGRTINWQSSQPSVADVSQTGLVTARAAGTTVITASAEGQSATATITVVPGAPATVAIESGDSQSGPAGTALASPLAVRVRDARGNPVSGVSVIWTVTSGGGSLSPNISTTDTQGIATSGWTLGASLGTQQAAASVVGAGSVTFTATATPAGPVLTRVEISPQSWNPKPGQARQFSAKAFDQNDQEMFGVAFTWSSSDLTIVTVTQTGFALALRKGNASIVVSAGQLSDAATVTVK